MPARHCLCQPVWVNTNIGNHVRPNTSDHNIRQPRFLLLQIPEYSCERIQKQLAKVSRGADAASSNNVGFSTSLRASRAASTRPHH